MPVRRRMCCPGGQRIIFERVGDAFCYAETHPTRERRFTCKSLSREGFATATGLVGIGIGELKPAPD